MVQILEHIEYPSEGFFWIINDNIVGISEEVPSFNYQYNLSGLDHRNTWSNFSSEYKVDNHEVEYDYYPRGRVMVDPDYDLDNSFTGYSVLVYLDDCIDSKKYRDMIAEYYNLNLKSIHNIVWTCPRRRAGIDHYTCHNCRK